jgi:hypothetical protein
VANEGWITGEEHVLLTHSSSWRQSALPLQPQIPPTQALLVVVLQAEHCQSVTRRVQVDADSLVGVTQVPLDEPPGMLQQPSTQ